MEVDIWNVKRGIRFTVKGIGNFEAEFPDAAGETTIEAVTARSLGLIPVDSVPPDAYAMAYMIAHLNHVIRRAPKKIPGKPPDFHDGETYDFGKIAFPEVVLRIWSEYSAKLSEFRNFLKESEFFTDDGGTPDGDESSDLLFNESAKPSSRVRRKSG